MIDTSYRKDEEFKEYENIKRNIAASPEEA